MLAVSASNCVKASTNRRMISKKKKDSSTVLWYRRVNKQLLVILKSASVVSLFGLWSSATSRCSCSVIWAHGADRRSRYLHFFFFPFCFSPLTEQEYGIECLPRHKRGRRHPATACQQNDMPYFELGRVYLSPVVTHYRECVPLFQAATYYSAHK